MTPELIAPTTHLHTAWLRAHREWGQGLHGDGELVRRVGHIGYGVRPSARGRGLATWALGRILEEARALGMDRVLIVCAADNIASARTIERHHGVLERIEDTDLGPVRRYRITITPGA